MTTDDDEMVARLIIGWAAHLLVLHDGRGLNGG
jgi:hypothetical protein